MRFDIPNRISTKIAKQISLHLFKNKRHLKPQSKIVTFTFDDFPETAVVNGSKILEKYCKHGTFYTSIGLCGTMSPSGRIAKTTDIIDIAKRGHEIACHTYSHLDCSENNIGTIKNDCEKNRRSSERIVSDRIVSFAYPKGNISPSVKKEIGKEYSTARTIERGINNNTIDLAALKSVPLYEKYGRDQCLEWLNKLEEDDGWLIFYTHDVETNPSVYGCTNKLLEELIVNSINREFEILTVRKAVCDFVI